MKIGLVSPYDYAYPGGVSLHISQLARQLLARGHNVRIIAPCSQTPTDGLKDFVIPLGRPIPVPSGGSIARITLSIRLSAPVKRLLARENFDVVHIHEPLTPMLPVTFLRNSDCLNVGTFHAYHSKPRGYGLAKPILSHWFKRLHGRIAVSESAKKFVSRHFPADYHIIPNGIDIQRFSPAKKPIDHLNDGRLNILFVGRMEKRKGLDYLLKAYSLLKIDYPDARLVVVGPGERLLKKYKKIIQQNDIEDVVFAGNVPYDELPRYYCSCHVFCAPATGEESFGIVLLEAMACGKPVVATNIEGYAGLISNGKEGLLVRPKNERSLKDALCTFLADRSLMAITGERGRAKAEEYCWERVGGRILDYYEELLKDHPELPVSGGQKATQ